VGLPERHIHSPCSGKEECVSRKADDMMGGGRIFAVGGMDGIIAATADRCLCGRKRKASAVCGGEQVAALEQRDKVQNVYSRSVAGLTSRRDSCVTRCEACRRICWSSANIVFDGYCVLCKLMRLLKNVIHCDVYCMHEIVLQNSIILRRSPCDGKKEWKVRDGSKYGLLTFRASCLNSQCL
jgi:hypothetical protein